MSQTFPVGTALFLYVLHCRQYDNRFITPRRRPSILHFGSSSPDMIQILHWDREEISHGKHVDILTCPLELFRHNLDTTPL